MTTILRTLGRPGRGVVRPGRYASGARSTVIRVARSDRSISTSTPPVCRIWGDRWDADLAAPKHPPHAAPQAPPADPELPQASVDVETAAPNVLLPLDGAVVGTQSRDPNPMSRNFGPFEDASFMLGFKAGSNLTALCRDAQNTTVGRHSLVAAGAVAGLRLTLDAPSAAKGTGTSGRMAW